jgi:parvulin-like peptidyl-prolyl isomerase
VRTGARSDARDVVDPERIVAIVNGESIPQRELDQEMDNIIAYAPRDIDPREIELRRPRIRQEALENLIMQHIIHQLIMQHDIRPTPEQVEAEIEANDAYLQAHGSSLEARLRERDIAPQEMRASVRDRLAEQMLWDKLLSIKQPGEAQLREFYNDFLPRYAIPEAVDLYQIFVAFPAEQPPDSDRRRELREHAILLYQRLLAGERFELLAREYSDGPHAEGGGHVGWVVRESPLPGPVLDEAFRMELNQPSRPIRSAIGYHILKVVDHRKGRVASFEEVRDIVDSDCLSAIRKELVPDLKRRLRTDAHVVIPRSSSPADE